MKKFLIMAAMAAFVSSAQAQDAHKDAHKMVSVEEIKWIDHPLFKGAKTVFLIGDPTKAELIVQRTKFPPNYRVPPHTHPYTEVVTVLTGSYGNNFADKIEPNGKIKMMKPGSFFVLPANHAHYTWTGSKETIVQVEFVGPGGATFINPADDPRKK